MSRSLQDQFIDDDEEETCPLCVEEFDLTDKGFRPCPCGYQICQFCYNNVKNNMNGLCPACRRPYRDEDIDYKVITSEEAAAHKARQAQKQKKTQAALQKEKQKAEADNLSRKHLAGMRVVQKNLVYVTGLSPTIHEDQLLQTLRGEQYFGQYGKIIKIVVSKAKDHSHPHSVGVYVTYERKEDAANCIAAVDGSKNGERTLRAQFGTTKYCSAYLRGETCTNRNCMFLHEPGEANESYSRADLSALNAGSTQHGHGRAPPPQSQQPVASATQPMARQSSSDQPSSPAPDRPALPSTASWASKPPQQSRAESRSTSTTMESPAPVVSTPAEPLLDAVVQPDEPPTAQVEASAVPESIPQPYERPRKSQIGPLISILKKFNMDDFKLIWSPSCLPPADMEFINNYPPLFDQNGGLRMRLRRQREEEQRQMEQEAQAFQQPPAVEQDDNPEMSGSLQLGGEPEERQSISQAQGAIHPPGQDGALDQRFQFGGDVPSPGISDRGMTPQQHQQMLLQALKPSAPGGYNQPSNFSTPYQQPQQQQPQQQSTTPLGHQRNVSRYSFANDSSSASAAVKPVANSKVMNQQSSMMPQAGNNHFGAQHQQPHGQFYTSNVQGPPPGLKTTGTPPVSGNLTFGQGHGFATGGLQYGVGASRNQQDSYYRELLRGREPGNGVDAKHDADFPPLAPPTRQQSITSRVSLDEPRISTPPVPPGFEGQLANESRRSTPTVPPGLARPSAVPDLEGSSSRQTSRPSSRASMRRAASQIMPALPLRPGTPARIATPSRKATKDETDIGLPDETPTKPSRKTTTSDLKSSMSVQNDDDLVKNAQDADLDTSTSAVPDNVPAPTENDQKPEAGAAAELTASKSSSPVAAKSVPSQIRSPLSEDSHVKPAGKTAPVTPSKTSIATLDTHKRKHPGKLDITAAVNKHELENAPSASETSTPGKSVQQATLPTSSTPKLPESPIVASPAIKSAPRTLRVVQTPKTETPSHAFPPILPNVASHRLPSRRPSVASINPPGTPSSEQVSMSDNISLTSTSQSRANSPPPPTSKIGSAPVRTKTKNQMKKERQERAKALEEEKAKVGEAEKPSTDEPAQEAILSRKKKAKKEKEPKLIKTKPSPAVTDTTPTASRPVSPGKSPATAFESPIAKPEAVMPAVQKDSRPATPVKPISTPHSTIPSPAAEPSPPPTPTLTPAQLIAELKASAPEIQKCIDNLFRVSNSHHFKTPSNVSHKELLGGWKSELNVKLSKEEVDALLTGKVSAVHRGGDDGRTFDRHMVSPSGAHLRALTKELESRFLELEKALREMPEELKFRPAKPQNEMKLPSIDLEELKRKYENATGRGVSVMEQMVQDGSTMKKGAFLVDEASKYINEFVMPPVTPPSSAGNGQTRMGQSVTQVGAQQPSHGNGEGSSVPPVEIAERSLAEAKRQADERENALRKMLKKNKRILGLG